MKNYGFQRPLLDNTQYRILGANSLPKTVLQLDGDWTPYLPKYERQFGNNFDTYNCTGFGTLNVIETILNKKNGKI